MEYLQNNKRIAKNTLMLYMRSILIMLVSLYTSRIVLDELGIVNYGIFDAVGGIVSMFTVISGALSNAISRFITFELGSRNKDKLKRIFSTSVNIQIGISLIVVLLGESIGMWFLNTQMNIPMERMTSANWVLHCSLIGFAINLVSIPYNAAIIAHEQMSAFAYIGILEVALKLLIVYLLALSSVDKLITYSVLYVVTAVIIRLVYSIYCKKHFEETRYQLVYDKELLKEMFVFTGWNFTLNAAAIFNSQGINLLINIFFGVTVNAARGITNQVQGALMKFVNDFTTAFNPQITKCYAVGELQAVHKLINRGAKFSFFLSLFICLPVFVETDYILNLWLTEVPEFTVIFVRLSIIGALIDRLGNTSWVACMATGNIRRYSIWITSVGCLAFPITYIAYLLNAPVEICYIIYAAVYLAIDGVRLWIMKGLIRYPVMSFVCDVVCRILFVTILSYILPYLILQLMLPSFLRFIVSTFSCLLSVVVMTYFFGLTINERKKVTANILQIVYEKVGK